MNRSVLSIVMVIISLAVKAQIPQGINYQGVAHDGVKPITTTLPVRITIQSDSLGGLIYWVEEHPSVQPNEYGLFSLVVGKGTKISGIARFEDIDWSTDAIYIKTEINYDGWITMGASRIWSVPYSMVAKNLAGPFEKLGVEGKTNDMAEALFEVKNKDGQSIFAVYNEGVRINVADGDSPLKGSKGGFAIGGFDLTKGTTHDLFVVSPDSIRAYIYDDPLAKASKGGFAIGGFDLSKGTTNDYLVISPDSARIYVDNSPSTKGSKGGFAIGGFDLSKGISQKFLTVSNDSIRMYIDDQGKGSKGGFAIGGFDLTKGVNQKFMTVSNDSIRMYIDDQGKGAKGGFAIGGFDLSKGGRASFLDVAIDTSGVINPSQNRILWYPVKNAFLTGKVLIENPDSVGENSFASGFESKALGDYSQALGFNIIARGNYSTAIGKNATANAENSVSIGNHSRADKSSSFAFGTGAIAFGENSYAIGSSGVDSAGFPTGNTMSVGDQSFAIGMGAQSNGLGSLSFGTQCIADKEFSLAAGYLSKALGYGSIAVGYKSYSSDIYSVALGSRAIAQNGGVALGQNLWASGSGSVAIGGNCWASGAGAVALGGQGSFASGKSSLSIGVGNTEGEYSFALGGYIKEFLGVDINLISYHSAIAIGNHSGAIGFGVQSTGNSSFAIGNGDFVAFEDAGEFGTESIGDSSFAVGNYVKSIGVNSFALGNYTTAQAFKSLVLGQYNVISGNSTSWVLTDPLFVVGNGTTSSSRSNALTILKNGYTGIGSSTPNYKLLVYESKLDTYAMRIFNDANSYRAHGLRISCGADVSNTGTTYAIDFRDGANNAVGSITITNHVVSFNETSDSRLKTNIQRTDLEGITTINRIPVMDYAFKDNPAKMLTGFIAQDLLEVLPDAVITDEEGYYQIARAALIPVLTKAIQEQQKLIEEKDLKIKSLEERLVQIESVLGIN